MKKLFLFYINVNVLIFSVFRWMLTFFTDKIIFNNINKDNFISYLLCKGLLLVIFIIWHQFLFRAIFSKNKDDIKYKKILKYSLIYFIPMIIFAILSWPTIFPWGDQIKFFEYAINFDYWYHLNYLTTLFHIISMMILPIFSSPMLIQIIMNSLIVGYIIYRAYEIYNSKKTYILYLIFFLPPSVYYGLLPNRLPIYGMLYLLYFSILLFDYIQKNSLNKIKLILLLILSSVLSCWRSEGIYLLVISPVLINSAYFSKLKLKNTIKYMLITLTLTFIIMLPQNISTTWKNPDYNIERMKATYTYTIPIMYKLGLNIDKYQKLDKFLSIQSVKKMVEELGTDIYKDNYIGWHEKYKGIRENYSKKDYKNFIEECLKIINENKILFLKSKLNTLHYTATNRMPFGINDSETLNTIEENYKIENGDFYFISPIIKNSRNFMERFVSGVIVKDTKSKFINNIVNLIKKITYNLYIPFLILLYIFIDSLIRKNWLILFTTLGLLVNVILVILLAPAAYFMYYYPVYIISYFMLFMKIINYFHKRDNMLYNIYGGKK